MSTEKILPSSHPSLPRFLICRECPEIPSCETIIERETGHMVRILKLDTMPTDQPGYQIAGYRIFLQALTTDPPLTSMGMYLYYYITAHPNKFKKWKL